MFDSTYYTSKHILHQIVQIIQVNTMQIWSTRISGHYAPLILAPAEGSSLEPYTLDYLNISLLIKPQARLKPKRCLGGFIFTLKSHSLRSQ